MRYFFVLTFKTNCYGFFDIYTIPRLKCTSSLRAQQSNPEKIIFHFKRGIVLYIK